MKILIKTGSGGEISISKDTSQKMNFSSLTGLMKSMIQRYLKYHE